MNIIDSYLEHIPAAQHALVRELADLITAAAPDLELSLKWNNPTWHGKRNVCAIVCHRAHVNLQICGGVNLADPEQLLQGTGKGMRHVQLLPDVPLPRQAIMALVAQAATSARNNTFDSLPAVH